MAAPLRLRIALPPRRRQSIPLTSLVDVVFILLFFFMLASSYLDWRAYPLNLGAAPGSGSGSGEALVLTVLPDGATLNGQALDPAALQRRLEGAGRPVVVVPADGVSMQQLVDWLDRLKRWGLSATLARPPGT